MEQIHPLSLFPLTRWRVSATFISLAVYTENLTRLLIFFPLAMHLFNRSRNNNSYNSFSLYNNSFSSHNNSFSSHNNSYNSSSSHRHLYLKFIPLNPPNTSWSISPRQFCCKHQLFLLHFISALFFNLF